MATTSKTDNYELWMAERKAEVLLQLVRKSIELNDKLRKENAVLRSGLSGSKN